MPNSTQPPTKEVALATHYKHFTLHDVYSDIEYVCLTLARVRVCEQYRAIGSFSFSYLCVFSTLTIYLGVLTVSFAHVCALAVIQFFQPQL